MEQKEIKEHGSTDGQPEFIIFENNQYPEITDPHDDAAIFYIINAGYILKNRQKEFEDILYNYAEFEKKSGKYKFNKDKSKDFLDLIIKQRALSEISVGALGNIAGHYLRLLEKMGAKTKQIDLENEPLKAFNGWQSFDITFSIGQLDLEEMKKHNPKNPKMLVFQNYALLSNLTKMDGFSINSNGDQITTLYDLFFQLVGFKIKEYIKTQNLDYGFTIILRRLNNQKISESEFDYIFQEIKKRNPIRYF
jgi:hypothetical protein